MPKASLGNLVLGLASHEFGSEAWSPNPYHCFLETALLLYFLAVAFAGFMVDILLKG